MSSEIEINNTVNGSFLDDDIFSDAVDDSSYSYQRNQIFVYSSMIIDITRFLIGILALASDIYLIVIISKFKNLQNRINKFILQYAIFHILYLVLATFILVLLEVITVRIYRYNSYCLVTNLDHLTLTLSFYVLLFMAVDWYVSNCYTNIYDRYPKTFKYGAYILYLFAIPKWIATSTICFINRWQVTEIRFHFELASFTFYLIIIAGITILKRKKVLSSEACKTEYALTIPRIVLLWSLFMFIVRLISLFVDDAAPRFVLSLLFIVHGIAEDIFVAIPIIVVYQLAKLNKNFKSAYLKSCKKKRVGNYDDDNLDGDSVNEASPNNITYDRRSERSFNVQNLNLEDL